MSWLSGTATTTPVSTEVTPIVAMNVSIFKKLTKNALTPPTNVAAKMPIAIAAGIDQPQCTSAHAHMIDANPMFTPTARSNACADNDTTTPIAMIATIVCDVRIDRHVVSVKNVSGNQNANNTMIATHTYNKLTFLNENPRHHEGAPPPSPPTSPLTSPRAASLDTVSVIAHLPNRGVYLLASAKRPPARGHRNGVLEPGHRSNRL